MPVIDTSWLIGLLDPDDAHHKKAVEQAKAPGLYTIPGVVLAEFIPAVAAKLRRMTPGAPVAQTIRDIVRKLLANPGFEVEPNYPVKKVHETYLARTSLSYPDTVAAVLALILNQDLLTFDDAQQRAFKELRKGAA